MNYSAQQKTQFWQEKSTKPDTASIVAVIAILLSIIGLGVAIYSTTKNSDWLIFVDAVTRLDPYSSEGGFFNPIFVIPILYPFALLPAKLGGAVWSVVNIIVTVICIVQLSSAHKLLRIVLALTCIPIIAYVDMAQIGVISLVGITLMEKNKHQWLAPILVISKPQLFSGSLIIWLKKTGWTPKLIAGAVFLLSLIVYGLWPIDMLISMSMMGAETRPNNLSIFVWPYGIAIGLALLAIGYKRNSYLISALATPFLFPYFSSYSLFPFLAYMYAKWDIKLSIAVYVIVQLVLIIRFASILF